MATSIKPKLSVEKPKRKKMKDMTLDEFFNADMDSDSESSSKSSETSHHQLKYTKKAPRVNENKKKETSQSKAKKQKGNKNEKSSLAKTLLENDPEFYEYLKGEDQTLLNNLKDLSDEDDNDSEQNIDDSLDIKTSHSKASKPFEKGMLDMSSEEDDSEVDNEDSYVHKLPDRLEVASDDSGTESEDDQDDDFRPAEKGIVVTNKLLGQWTEQLRHSPSPKIFKEIVSAFHGAVHEAGGKTDETVSLKYRIQGSAAFNGIVRLCLLHAAPALQTILQVQNLFSLEIVSDKSKRWKKIKSDIKSYTSALLQLLAQLSEAAMINAILKHIHKLVIFYAAFPKTSRTLLKHMIKTWTKGEETSRVLAFLCINKLIHLKRDPYLEICVKRLYMAYVSNCKFVSPTTLPLINFMQHSLVEVLSNDFVMAYQYAFVYIRQLAIHLRNAISVRKKNMHQVVYNWQYIHCLSLWVQLVSSYPNDTLKPLIYPLTQTIIGTIKLVPTARHYPLRFHCVKLLNILSSKTNTFIPTLPFLLDVFEQTDFNKRHKSVSLKPFNFAVILKFSKSQVSEKAFKDGLIDQSYELLLESYKIHAHSVGFPELIIPSLLQLKDFIKKCKIANYCKQIKQIVEKIEEQSKFIVDRRKQSTLRLDDFDGVRLWEQKIDSSPLRKFYTSWRKLRDRELQHDIAGKEVISGAAIDIPSISYKKAPKATPEERESLSKLFEDESDSDNETRFLLKEERPDRPNKKRKRSGGDSESDSDDYSDFDEDELEQLARSASEDDDSDSEEEEEEDEEDKEIVDKSINQKRVKKSMSANKVNMTPKAKKGQILSLKELQNEDDADDIVEDFVWSDSDSESD